MENTNSLPEIKARASEFIQKKQRLASESESTISNSPCFYLITEQNKKNQKPQPGIFLKGYNAISAVGVMLGDIGGAIANTDIPSGYVKATVNFCAFTKFSNSEDNIESVSQVMCIPKNSQPDQRTHKLLDAITFDSVDMTIDDTMFPQDHLERFDEDDATLYLGVGFWSLQITQLTTK